MVGLLVMPTYPGLGLGLFVSPRAARLVGGALLHSILSMGLLVLFDLRASVVLKRDVAQLEGWAEFVLLLSWAVDMSIS